MKKIKFTNVIGVLLFLFVGVIDIYGQSTAPNNIYVAGRFLGWNATNLTNPLEIRTNNLLRMNVNGRLNFNAAYLSSGPNYVTWLNNNYTPLGYGLVQAGFKPEGFVGINTDQPRTRLHIQGDQITIPNVGTGYRPWMRTGVYMNEESNNMYVGLYKRGDNRPGDAVVNWGDDYITPTNRLRINFTPSVLGLTAATPIQDHDLEMMSFWASRNVGVGDLINFTNGPQSHLHVHNAFGNTDYMQVTTTNTGFLASDGLRLGIPNAANGQLQSSDILYNQEQRHLLFSTNANTNLINMDAGTTFERMRITSINAPTNLPGGNVGVWNPGTITNTNLTRVAISHDPGQPVLRPMSLLHLGYNVTGVISPLNGWRSWMDVGMFTSQGTDNLYIGMKREPSTNPLNQGDRFDAVINWGDNMQSGLLPEGPDNLRFIFTSGVNDPLGTPLSTSQDGVEVMRLTPNNLVTNPNVINKPSIGIGNFTGIPVTANNYVGATLDIDGDLRIRSVNQNNNLTQVLVRDSSDFGRVYWRDASTLGGTANVQANNGCSIDPTTPGRVQWGNDLNNTTANLINDREINMSGFNVYFKDQFADINGVQNAMGIGYNITTAGTYLPAKLSVNENQGYIPYPVGTTSGLYNTYVGSISISGINLDAGSTAGNTSNINLIGVYGEASGIEDNTNKVFHSGGRFFGSNAQNNIGVEGIGEGSHPSSGTTTGGRFVATANTFNGGLVGASGQSNQGLFGTGVFGSGSNAQLTNWGVRGFASGTSLLATYYGGEFLSSGPLGTPQYGIYASAPNDPGLSYAGWFNGDVFVNGSFGTSDSTVKSNIQNLSNATVILNQLNAKSFQFDNTTIPQLTIDNDTHYGLIAQDVENVLPTLVQNTTVPAVYDSLGNVIYPSAVMKTLNYTELIPILIAGFNEQQHIIRQQDSTIQSIQNTLNQLITQVNQCCNSSMPLNTPGNNHGNTLQDNRNIHSVDIKLTNGDYIILNQNHPNPFAENTTITYHIPERIQFAQIIFYNNLGQIIKIVDIEERGDGKINVFAGDLSSGMYSYTLVVDGQIHDTKKMIKQ